MQIIQIKIQQNGNYLQKAIEVKAEASWQKLQNRFGIIKIPLSLSLCWWSILVSASLNANNLFSVPTSTWHSSNLVAWWLPKNRGPNFTWKVNKALWNFLSSLPTKKVFQSVLQHDLCHRVSPKRVRLRVNCIMSGWFGAGSVIVGSNS